MCDYGKCKNIAVAELKSEDWILDLEDIEKDSGKIIAFHSFEKRKSESTKHIFHKGDLLYSKLRPYLNKVVIAPKDGFCTSEILPLNFNGVLLNKFAQKLLMSPFFLSTVNMLTYGVKMPRLGTDDAKEIFIPLPSLFEQQRIVAKIEELFAKLDFITAVLTE
ncbi:restriction endonuclease subunit S [Treponema vincentii]